ncbi:MAG: tRNA (adenosine(37)-N6)-dimethylallyltransferase MiaA [Cyclobacteriaceae bacterium]
MCAARQKVLVVVMGPTAVGKTAVAIELAKHLKTEIVSADSRQLYKEIDIGTAKPNVSELQEVKHHYISEVPLEMNYSAGQYGRDANVLIDRLFESFDHVVLCGGSGLYIRAILEGFDDMPEVTEKVRNEVIKDYEQHGLKWLQQQVLSGDPEYFAKVDKSNPQRLMRALEIMRATGQKSSGLRKNEVQVRHYKVVKVGLDLPREELYDRINRRVDRMIEVGLVEEAKGLYPRKSLNALQTVGYQELFGHFDGAYDFEEAVRLLKRNTRRYAKRQMTWFGKEADIQWFSPGEFRKIIKYINGE